MEQENTSSQQAVFAELCKISTNNQWAVLSAVLTKLNKRPTQTLSEHQLTDLLKSTPEPQLSHRGIWVQFFGEKYLPIVCVNPAFGRASQEQGADRPCKCKSASQEGPNKYFGSMSYNAGRHQSDISAHIATCAQWRPPKAGHLHSWRRGFTKE